MNKTTRALLPIAVAGAAGALAGGLRARFHLLTDLGGWQRFPTGMRWSLGLWVLFRCTDVAARDKAPTKTGESSWSRQLHVIAVNVALLALVFPIPGLTRRFLPDSVALEAAGLAIQAGFILLAVWARRHLGANWSGEVRIAEGHELVRSGPYAFLRDPIYTALLGMYVGTSLVSGETHALVALAIVMLAYWRKIALEERALGDAFPTAYEDYRRATRAWIPGVH